MDITTFTRGDFIDYKIDGDIIIVNRVLSRDEINELTFNNPGKKICVVSYDALLNASKKYKYCSNKLCSNELLDSVDKVDSVNKGNFVNSDYIAKGDSVDKVDYINSDSVAKGDYITEGDSVNSNYSVCANCRIARYCSEYCKLTDKQKHNRVCEIIIELREWTTRHKEVLLKRLSGFKFTSLDFNSIAESSMNTKSEIVSKHLSLIQHLFIMSDDQINGVIGNVDLLISRPYAIDDIEDDGKKLFMLILSLLRIKDISVSPGLLFSRFVGKNRAAVCEAVMIYLNTRKYLSDFRGE